MESTTQLDGEHLCPPWELFFLFVHIKPKKKFKDVIFIKVIIFLFVHIKPKKIFKHTMFVKVLRGSIKAPGS